MAFSNFGERCHQKLYLHNRKDRYMKRRNNFYHLIYNRGNLLLAHNKAKKGKLHYSEVKYVENNLDYCLTQLR